MKSEGQTGQLTRSALILNSSQLLYCLEHYIQKEKKTGGSYSKHVFKSLVELASTSAFPLLTPSLPLLLILWCFVFGFCFHLGKALCKNFTQLVHTAFQTMGEALSNVILTPGPLIWLFWLIYWLTDIYLSCHRYKGNGSKTRALKTNANN